MPQSLVPIPRHAERLPPHIGAEQLGRIRHAVHHLPQVVKPADYLADTHADFETHLDKLGLILLQKPVAGQRPSRWIDPALIDAALAHLDTIGSGPKARPLMLERTTALEQMAVSRRAGVWTRLIRHTMTLSEPEWKVPVLFRIPVDPNAVWAFYRNGDAPALLAALGPPPQHPQGAELTAHLEALLARSRSFKARHLESLLPRLQSEGGTAQPLPEMLSAFTRAQERWEHRVAELDTLEGLNTELAFQGYPDTFNKARQLQRRVTLYVGPPNSGKTHAAFERRGWRVASSTAARNRMGASRQAWTWLPWPTSPRGGHTASCQSIGWV